jgi:hypothetical protein
MLSHGEGEGKTGRETQMRRGRGGEGGEEANKLCEPDPVQGSGFRVRV